MRQRTRVHTSTNQLNDQLINPERIVTEPQEHPLGYPYELIKQLISKLSASAVALFWVRR